MKNKKRIIQNLLTTASILTIATMATTDAMAAAAPARSIAQAHNGGGSAFGTLGHWLQDDGATAFGRAIADGDYIKAVAGQMPIGINNGAKVIIDVNGVNTAGGIFEVSVADAFIAAFGGAVKNTLKITDNHNVTLGTGGYAGGYAVGPVVAGNFGAFETIDFNAHNQTVFIKSDSPTAEVTIPALFSGDLAGGGAAGTVDIDNVNGKTVRLTGGFDATPAQQVNNLVVKGGATAILAFDVANVANAANRHLTLAAGVTLGDGAHAGQDGTLVVGDGINVATLAVDGQAANIGVLKFVGGSVVTAQIGNVQPLKNVIIEPAAAGKVVDFQNVVLNAQSITFSNANSVLQLGSKATVVTGNLVGAGSLNVVFSGAGADPVVNGDIGASDKPIKQILVDNRAANNLTINGTKAYANDILIGNAANSSKLVFGANLVNVKATNGIKFQSNVGGDTLTLAGNAAGTTITGDLTSPNAPINTALIEVGAGKTTIIGNIGTKDKNFKSIAFGAGTLTVDGDVFLSKTIAEKGIDFTAGDGKFILKDGKTITGSIEGAAAPNGNGTLTFEGSGTVTGYADVNKGLTKIGDTAGAGNSLKAIEIGVAGAAPTTPITVTLNASDIKTKSLKFIQDGTVILPGSDNVTLALGIVGAEGLLADTTGVDGKGKITAAVVKDKTLTIKGQVAKQTTGVNGTWTNSLGELEITDAGNLTLDVNGVAKQYIQKIKLANENSTLTLTGNGGAHTYVFTLDNAGVGKNTVIIGKTAAITLGDAKNGVTIGTEKQPVKFVDIQNDTTFQSSEAEPTQLYASDTILAGNFIFKAGTHNIGTNLGDINTAVGTLILQTAGAGDDPTVVKLINPVYSGAITLQDKTTLVVKDVLARAAKIDGAALNNGTLVFDNDAADSKTAASKSATIAHITDFVKDASAAYKYEMPIGAAFALADIQVAQGGYANLSNATPATAKITFKHDTGNTDRSVLALTGDNTDLTGITIATEGTGAKDVLYLAKNTAGLVIDRNVGEETKQLGAILFGQDNNVIVKGVTVYAGLSPVTTNTVSVVFDDIAADATVRTLGWDGKLLKSVKFNNDAKTATVLDSISATDAEVKATAIVHLGGTINVTNGLKIKANPADTTSVTFLDKAKVQSLVTSDVANEAGKIIFAGDATITKDIGASGKTFSEVTFNGDNTKTVSLGSNISATKINIGSQETVLTTDATLNGIAIIKNGNINVGTNTLTFNNVSATDDSTIIGDTTLSFVVDDNNKSGIIKIVGTKQLDLSGASGTITISDETPDLPGEGGRVVKLFDAASMVKFAGNQLTPFAVSEYAFRGYDYNKDTGVLTITDQSFRAIKNALKGAASDNLAGVIANTKNTDDARAYNLDLEKMRNNPDAIKESITRLDLENRQSTKEGPREVMNVVSDVVTSGVQDAANNVVSRFETPMSISSAGAVAAGDEAGNRFGAWFRPFYGQGTQDAKTSKTSGYKTTNFGASFGIDTMLNDNAMIGLALSGVKTDVKFKDSKEGDKTKVSTFLVSLYGMYKFVDTNWFVQGIGNFGKSTIKSDEARLASNGKPTAKNSFNPTIFGIEALGGYTLKTSESAMLVPMFGLAFNRIGGVDYKQTGTTNQNLSIKQGAINKVEAIAGFKAMTLLNVQGTDVTPEVHAFVRQSLNNKDVKVTSQLNGAAQGYTTSSSKVTKTMFNVGFGVNAKSGCVEYGAGYDMHLADKYMGHQGTLKVRLSF